MPIEVKLSDVIEALETAMDGHAYYLDKRSGESCWRLMTMLPPAENQELMLESPDWQKESIATAREVLNDSENFLPLPDKFEIHEYKIMEEFCLALDNRQVGSELHRLIKGSGAFRRFIESHSKKQPLFFSICCPRQVMIQIIRRTKIGLSLSDCLRAVGC